jgi:hypothetical protein
MRLATVLLEQLAEAAFFVPAVKRRSWTWGPQPMLAERIDQLAAVYAQDLVGVTELIHSRADSRARQFADAFRLRKES